MKDRTNHDTLLRQIANTIVANASVSYPGKFDVCLFLYKYAELYNAPVYEILPNKLIKETFIDFDKKVDTYGAYPLAEIGIGLIRLIDAGFVEDTENSDILKKIDKIIFENELQACYHHRLKTDNPYITFLYIYYRLKLYSRNLNKTYYNMFIRDTLSYVKDKGTAMLDKKYNYVCILYLCLLLKHELKYKDVQLSIIISRIVSELCVEDIKALIKYKPIKYCFIRITQVYPKEDKNYPFILECFSVIENLHDESSWYSDSWISILYGIDSNLSGLAIRKKEIGVYMRDSYYDSVLVSQRLSGVGLSLLFNHIN